MGDSGEERGRSREWGIVREEKGREWGIVREEREREWGIVG